MSTTNTSGKRAITPAEIKPGMTIRWTYNEITHECTVRDRDGADGFGGVLCHVMDQSSVYVYGDTPWVTVLAEPQPEEPIAFGARVVANGQRFTRAQQYGGDLRPWVSRELGTWFDWDDVLGLGPVAIIDADPSWTLPAQVKVAPVVPKRIEEWPENDEYLRAHQWRDCIGAVWSWSEQAGAWTCTTSAMNGDCSLSGPWTRVTDE